MTRGTNFCLKPTLSAPRVCATLIFKKKNTGELRDREFAGNFKAVSVAEQSKFQSGFQARSILESNRIKNKRCLSCAGEISLLCDIICDICSETVKESLWQHWQCLKVFS